MKNEETFEYLFNKSEKQNGHIYLANVTIRTIDKDTMEIVNESLYYKYGKTKDINKRFKMYGEAYKLIKCYNVNHMSLREELIRNDTDITLDRRENCMDERDEHHSFDISDIVDYYSNCEIKFIDNRIECISNEGSMSRPASFILNCFHL